MQFALIPVKDLSRAKARLAPAFDGSQRRELAEAILRDVLAAALACPALDGVAVAAGDPDVLSIAAQCGADGLAQPGGLNEALNSAAETLAERGVSRIVILAADLPLATPDAIERVAGAEADVAVAPAPDGGTNALALTPGAIAFHFGPDSARRHLDAAGDAGLRVRRLKLPSLALDIDTPEDVSRLRAVAETDRDAVGPHTVTALEKLSLVKSPVRKG